jgi:hypothetical protein
MISETKLDSTFPVGQFVINGFSTPFRLDRNRNGGGIMLYVREDIPVKLLFTEVLPIESFYVEINLRKKKWLLCCCYNPNKNLFSSFCSAISKSLDLYTSGYENLLLLGDFNIEVNDESMQEFCESYGLKSLIKDPTCFKNPENPSCIDLILTNKATYFQNSCTIETGLSDFHKMTISVMKGSFEKLKPKVINYRNYRSFVNMNFREDLIRKLSSQNLNNDSLKLVLDISTSVLSAHAPCKKKFVRGNRSPFMNKELSKATMTRARLRNKFLKDRSDVNRKAFSKQRNFCSSLLRKTKKKYYGNLNTNSITDNKKFWKTINPFLSDKTQKSDKITLIENDEIVSNEAEVSQILNSFFSNIVTNLALPQYICHDPGIKTINDPITRAVTKYLNHPSIIAIKEVCKEGYSFSFSTIAREDFAKEIVNLDISKSSQDTDIPTKIIKENIDIFTDYIYPSFNECIETSVFPDCLKNANVTPIFKKGSKTSKDNYRPVSILPNISKIFEKPLFNQISKYFENILSIYQCGFRKGYSTQICLVSFLEKWRQSVDKGKSFGALLTDLSKAFDCLSHELLVAKLHAYGFSDAALRLVLSYLSKRNQRTKVNSSYSAWEEILFGVPQGSILGPLLFNIFICDLFFIMKDTEFASYADDNTPYVSGKNSDEVISLLEEKSRVLFAWFEKNQMKANPEKCHLLLSTDDNMEINIDNVKIANSHCEKLLGIKIDRRLTFKNQIEDICRKASGKLHALSRVTPYMDLPKKRLILNAFFKSQFNYCPLVWMFHSRSMNNKINRLHERCLRIIYNDKSSSFNELLERDNSISVHEQSIRSLAIEMFKVVKGIASKLFSEIFGYRENMRYNFRNDSIFTLPPKRTVHYGTESIAFLGPKIWEIIPRELKEKESLREFKIAIKNWKLVSCPCRLCKTYIQGVGFV